MPSAHGDSRVTPYSTILASIAACLLVTGSAATAATVVIDLSSEPVPTVVGTRVDEQFGYAGDSGDVDDDGASELAVGAPGRPSARGPEAEGAVYLFEADAVATLDSPALASDVCSAVVSGGTAGERFGETVLVADVDADGSADLVVGAPSWGPGERVATGRVYVFLGPLGMSRSVAASDADVAIQGELPGDHFGSSLADGDIDGDGVNELLVSAFRAGSEAAPGAGSVYVLRAEDVGGARRQELVSDVARSWVRGDDRGDALRGIALVTGDHPRVALGSYHADGPGQGDTDAGRVTIVDGSALMSVRGRGVSEVGSSTMFGPKPRGFLGRSMSVGDLDGDGAPDILVSAYASRGDNSKADASGEAFIAFGEQDGFPDTIDLRSPAVAALRGRERWDLFGLPVLLTDLGGDGHADAVISAQFADSPDGTRRRCGEVHVYRGGLRSVLFAKAGAPDLADLTIVGERSLDALGGCLFTTPAGARLPGLVIGAPDADGSDGERTGKIHFVGPDLLSRR